MTSEEERGDDVAGFRPVEICARGKLTHGIVINSSVIVELRKKEAMHLVVLCAGYGTRLARDWKRSLQS